MNKYKKIIFTLYCILGAVFAVIPFLLRLDNNSVNYSFLINSLRFFLSNESQNALEIATHNWAIVALSLIANLYTFGLAGILIVPVSSFIIGATVSLKTSFLVIIFTFLEALNILLSVIFSVNIVVKRKDNKISFGKMYICCFKALALIYIIFLFSAFIEVQILPKF